MKQVVVDALLAMAISLVSAVIVSRALRAHDDAGDARSISRTVTIACDDDLAFRRSEDIAAAPLMASVDADRAMDAEDRLRP